MEQKLHEFLVLVQTKIISIEREIEYLNSEVEKLNREKNEGLMIGDIARKIVNDKYRIKLKELESKLSLYPTSKQMEKIEIILFKNKSSIIKKHLRELIISIPDMNPDMEMIFLDYCEQREIDLIEDKKNKSNERIEEIKKLKEARTYVVDSKNKTSYVKEKQTLYDIEEDTYAKKADSLFTLFEQNIGYDIIEELLPKENNYDYFDIKNNLLKKLQEYYGFWEDIYINSSGEDKIESGNIMRKCLEDISFINDYYSEISKEEANRKEEKKFNLLFSKTKFNHPHVLSDLDNIPNEYRDSLERLLEKLDENNFSTSKEKHRKISNNGSLAGIFELKDFKVRVLYKMLGKNHFYVIGINYKQAQNEICELEKMARRNSMTNTEYNEIKTKIANNEDISDLLQDSQSIYNDLINEIQETKRGKGVKN